MTEISKLAETYIKKQERFYNRPLKAFNKFIIKDFAKFISGKEELGLVKISGEQAGLDEIPNGSKVAFISEEIGHLTGGRYYAWFLACAMCELGYDVTIYTNQEPTYYDSFAGYKRPKIELVRKDEIENLDVQADVYISSPLLGNIAVTKLREKYNKPAFILIFDPSPLMKKYLGSVFMGWERLVELVKRSDVNIISLCNFTSSVIPEWLNKRENQIFPVYPCINSRDLDKVNLNVVREDYVVFISRLVKHKGVEDVLKAVKENGVKLKIISSNDGLGIENLLRKYKLNKQVELCMRISDVEKFEILAKAKAVINASYFEGFGMWAIEAFATGTPLVCYDFPTIKEIEEFSGADNFYFAEMANVDDLTKKLRLCLDEAKFAGRNRAFDYDVLVNRMGQVINPEPKIGVVTIALNEEKFIGASLKSVIRHKNVSKVAVIEGAVNLFAHACNEKGLSLDDTEGEVLKVMKLEGGEKIIYDRFGWATDKSELRNRALKLFGRDITHVLVVDADEIWGQEELDILVQAMKDNPMKGMFSFNFNHFWKQKDLIAKGSMWDSQLFRCFRYTDKNLHWKNHATPVVNARGEFINVTHGQVDVKGVKVYHLGYLKDENRVLEKLEYYKKRDKNLDVDAKIYTDWKPGKETQPTHHGGTAVKFEGKYPDEMQELIDNKII